MVDRLQDLKTYSDIRKHVTPTAFARAMSYMSWHNRLTFTDLLLPWEGLVVSYAHESKQIDPFMYNVIKAYLDETRSRPPATIEECRRRAADLIDRLSPRLD